MNCAHFQDQLPLYLGQDQLPGELQKHVADCPECHAIWKELATLGDRLQRDDSLVPNDGQVEQLVSEVDSAIEKIEQAKRFSVPSLREVWHKYVPVAAAAALVLAIGVGGYLVGRTGFDTNVPDLASPEVVIADSYEESSEELDENTVGSLIYDFAAQHSYEATEWLLDDLTEEEFDFLENSFDVGELL